MKPLINLVFDEQNLYERLSGRPGANVQRLVHSVLGVAQTERFAQAPVTTHWGSGLLTGVEPQAQLYRKNMVSGRWFTARDRNVLVLSKTAANRAHLRVGDTLRFHDDLHAASWRIIGIAVDSNGLGLKFAVMLAPIAEVNSFRGLPRDFTNALLVVSTSQDQPAINALSSRIDSKLAASGLSASTQTAKEFKDAAVRMVSIINMLL